MQDTSYLGVYSVCLPNARGQLQKRMHFVWAEDAGKYRVQALDGAFQPVGSKKLLGPVEFKKNYTHEPSILAVPVSAGTPWRNIAGKQEEQFPQSPTVPGLAGDRAPTSAAPEAPPANAAASKQTEKYLRDFFAKTLKRVRFSKERSAALNSLKTVIEVEEGIVQEHKYMFADFGVALRKNDLLELALACCKRVLDLSPEDDHAHFNIARIFLEMDRLDDAEQHILTAQSLNSAESVYQKMLDHMQTERRRRYRPQKKSKRTAATL